MDGPRVSCLVKSDRKRQILHAFTYMRNLKNKMHEYSKAERNLQIQRTNERRMIGKGENGRRGLRGTNYHE